MVGGRIVTKAVSPINKMEEQQDKGETRVAIFQTEKLLSSSFFARVVGQDC